MRTTPLTNQEYEALLEAVNVFNSAQKAAAEASTPEAHEIETKAWIQCRETLCRNHVYVVFESRYEQYVLGGLPPRLEEAEHAISALNQAEVDFTAHADSADPILQKEAAARFASAWTYLTSQCIDFYRDLRSASYKLGIEPITGETP